MTTPLIEACARAIGDWTYATQGEESDNAWDELPQRDREIFSNAARAVIPLVLTKAAEVARAEVVDAEATGASDDVAYNLACEHIAHSILALKPEAQS